MALTFRSTIPERYEIIGTDIHGRRRNVVATKRDGDFNWSVRLQHPNGENWSQTYHGNQVLDVMANLLASRDMEFRQDRYNGDRRTEIRDPNRPVYDGTDFAANRPRRWI
ncbi:hypothetical protein [Bradyrhizobium sp. Ai1a-2]|uniref:hypothetical protein n=1 Tax=Bradyrhizobium sp. Ai1a-2 TaxID=196490 RepID=UPI000489BF8C|nr:hypothetical protein [Bradyrhizobium sp. Ai1a-2]